MGPDGMLITWLDLAGLATSLIDQRLWPEARLIKIA